MAHGESKDEALATRNIVRQNTIRVGVLSRLKIRRRIRTAVRTGGESNWWWRAYRILNPVRYDDFRGFYSRNAHNFAQVIAARNGLPSQLVARLREFRKPANEEPFLLIRGLFPSRKWFERYSCDISVDPITGQAKPLVPRWYIAQNVYDMIGSTLLSLLGTRHRPKNSLESEIMFRDYLTSKGTERDVFSKDFDVPLRFRTIDPELLFPDEPGAEASRFAARYAVYVCVENPIHDPLLVLSVKTILDELPADARKLLQERTYQVFDHWDRDLGETRNSGLKSILQKADGNPWEAEMSFDANRIDFTQFNTTPAQRRAVAYLRLAIQKASRSATKITMKRGDALLIANHKALVRRSEADHSHHALAIIKRPSIRWIRAYVGFPTSASASVEG